MLCLLAQHRDISDLQGSDADWWEEHVEGIVFELDVLGVWM